MIQFLGSVTCQTRKIWGRVLIGTLEMPRIVKISSNDDTISQFVVA